VVGALLYSPAAAAPPTPVLDQASTSGSGTADLDECCDYTAQTFTAGLSGFLAGVNINTFISRQPAERLRVSIRDVQGSVPGERVLGTTVLPSDEVSFTQLITFSQRIPIRAGTKYAIVVNLERPTSGGDAGWITAAGNPYARGEACAHFKPRVSSSGWFCYSAEFGFPPFAWFDNQFRTYVTPAPTSKDQCDGDAWRAFGVFKNQGDCVSFVATKGKNPPAGG
jgi:hypothetical protein